MPDAHYFPAPSGEPWEVVLPLDPTRLDPVIAAVSRSETSWPTDIRPYIEAGFIEPPPFRPARPFRSEDPMSDRVLLFVAGAGAFGEEHSAAPFHHEGCALSQSRPICPDAEEHSRNQDGARHVEPSAEATPSPVLLPARASRSGARLEAGSLGDGLAATPERETSASSSSWDSSRVQTSSSSESAASALPLYQSSHGFLLM